MKVLMINHFPLTGSGSGTYTLNLAKFLKDLGHEVCIIFPENSKEYLEVEGIKSHPVFFSYQEEIEGALPFNFPCFTTHPRSIETFAGLSEENWQAYLEAFSQALEKEVEEFQPDVIHGQHVWVLSSLASQYDIPLVLTAHGTDLIGYQKWPEFRHYANQAIEHSQYVISISKDNYSLCEEIFPTQKDKFVLMRNGYDPGMFHQEDLDKEEVLAAYGISKEIFGDKSIISFAGKLTHFKGVDILLEASKINEDKGLKAITLIMGDGEEKENLLKQAEDLSLTSVYFLGNVNQDELRKLYNIADANLTPSRREAFGLVAIEAMACGTPEIASNEGGLPDFVSEEVGGLVAPENPQALAEKIEEVLGRYQYKDREAWRNEIAQYVKDRYAQDTIMKELVTLYEKAIAK